MSQMLAEIMRIVTEDISSRINQNDVIFEAITNSIQANATHITCTLQSNMNVLEGEDGGIGRKKIDNIVITDNGDGFTKDNYVSFCHYRTKHKKAMGCKGVGRFTYIKVYNNVNIVSEIVSEQKRKEFKFNLQFETDNLAESKATVAENQTTIEFSNITRDYLDLDNNNDKRLFLDIEEIKLRTLHHLIPILFFYKKQGVDITIDFIDSITKDKVSITKADIPNFKDIDFRVFGKNGYEGKFKLFYFIEEVSGKLHSYHCANNRTVCEFSDKELILNLPAGYSGFMLLVSEYMDSRVNNDRNDFDIKPNRIDDYSTISWNMINDEVKTVVTQLVKDKIPNSVKLNIEKLQKIQEERPYLVNYIDEQDINLAGFLDKKQIIDKAKKKFDKAKEIVLSNAGKAEYSDKELQDAIQIAQNELVSYINDRVQVIDRLQKLVDDKEKVEKVIHNLFMEMGTDSNGFDYFSINKNNLWLIDDRFTSYSYAASDQKIQKTLKAVGETTDGINNKLEEPDLALFFSHNPVAIEEQGLKSVLIEIKPFDYKTKPAKFKHDAVNQLLNYVEAFQTKDAIKEVHAFVVTDVDEEFARILKRDDFKPLFSTDAPIYFRYYQTTNITIYILSAKTIIKDAEARNKVFLEIMRKQGKLQKILEKDIVEQDKK